MVVWGSQHSNQPLIKNFPLNSFHYHLKLFIPFRLCMCCMRCIIVLIPIQVGNISLYDLSYQQLDNIKCLVSKYHLSVPPPDVWAEPTGDIHTILKCTTEQTLYLVGVTPLPDRACCQTVCLGIPPCSRHLLVPPAHSWAEPNCIIQSLFICTAENKIFGGCGTTS